MIHTREQLIEEIKKILNYHGGGIEVTDCAEDIADLIASLDDPNEWRNVP
jgi:hypothetical protein